MLLTWAGAAALPVRRAAPAVSDGRGQRVRQQLVFRQCFGGASIGPGRAVERAKELVEDQRELRLVRRAGASRNLQLEALGDHHDAKPGVLGLPRSDRPSQRRLETRAGSARLDPETPPEPGLGALLDAPPRVRPGER